MACVTRTWAFGGGHGGLRPFEIGLLLGRIDSREHVAGIDMRPDIDQSLRHTTTDAERQFGAHARLHVAGERDPGLATFELDDFGADQGRRLRRGRGSIFATRERQRGAHQARQTRAGLQTTQAKKSKTGSRAVSHGESLG